METTHVGSLPRDPELLALLRQPDAPAGELSDAIERAVNDVVERQRTAGITMISDGEQGKISYATYIVDRFEGLELQELPAIAPMPDLFDFPTFAARMAEGAGDVPPRPVCVGPVAYGSDEELRRDLANVRSALGSDQSGFMNAPSPGTIVAFADNRHYATSAEYLEAAAEAIRVEYEAIVEAGLMLQIDAPDIPIGELLPIGGPEDRLTLEARMEALDHALRNVPPERTRLHICWGNYEGPHHLDPPIETLLPALFKSRPTILLFEGANPRHEHEWEAWQTVDIPDDKILAPGVIDSTNNFIEHPRLVAQRLRHYADIVGADRVIASTDCGFGTFAGLAPVDTEICYAKLAAMSEGAALV